MHWGLVTCESEKRLHKGGDAQTEAWRMTLFVHEQEANPAERAEAQA